MTTENKNTNEGLQNNKESNISELPESVIYVVVRRFEMFADKCHSTKEFIVSVTGNSKTKDEMVNKFISKGEYKSTLYAEDMPSDVIQIWYRSGFSCRELIYIRQFKTDGRHMYREELELASRFF